eukprot:TCONS_00068217-protein
MKIMKSALLAYNNDALPRRRFLEDNVKVAQQKPFVVNCKRRKVPCFLDVIINDKTLSLYELQYNYGNNGDGRNLYFNCTCSLHNFGTGEVEVICSKTIYHSSADFFSYILCKNRSLCIFATHNENKGSIALSFGIPSKEIKRTLLHDLNSTIKAEGEITDFTLELSTDNEILCIMVESAKEVEIGEDIFEENFCDAHFFKCDFSKDDCLALEKMFSFDASLIGVCRNGLVFNISGDKILLFSDNGVIIYSLKLQSVIARQDIANIVANFEWSRDITKGEILVNFAKGQNNITVYTINHQEEKLTTLTSINYSDFIPNENFCKLAEVTSGTSFIVLAARSVYLIDPFTGQVVQRIIPYFVSFDCFVKHVTLNWCSNEVVVFYSEDDNKIFGQVFKLKTRLVERLLHSALKVVLLNYSINDLIQMNLPKSIKDNFFR